MGITPLLKLNGNLNKTTVLWENPSPDTQFPAQTIHLLSADYDSYIVFFKIANPSSGKSMKTESALKGYGIRLSDAYTTTSSFSVRSRDGVYVSDTEIRFSDARTDSKSGQNAVNNSNCVPFKILGIKA